MIKLNGDVHKLLDNINNANENNDYFLKNIKESDLNFDNDNNISILAYIITYNKKDKLGFTKEDILSILSLMILGKIDLTKQIGIFKMNILMLIIAYNQEQDLGFNKDDILSLLDNFDLNQLNVNNENIFNFIICEKKHLGFTKEDILNILDKFDLNQRIGFLKVNILMLIVFNNQDQKLEFTKEDIFNLIDRFDLTQQDICGRNIFHLILKNKIHETLKFTQADLLEIMNKIDLNQRDNSLWCVYDLIKYESNENKNFLSQDLISALLSKLDINFKDKEGNMILIRELQEGMILNSKEIVKKILDTNNKDIIQCVYRHISQISWTHEELLTFLNKNNLTIDTNAVKTICFF